MLEYARLILFGALLVSGLFIELTALVGVNRFRFPVNRLHPAGMGDTLGLLLIGLSAVVYVGFSAVTLKIILAAAILWLTSPVCTHLIGRLVQETEETKFDAEAKEWKP